MNRLANGQRIRVTDPEHPLRGVSGTVGRARRADSGCWVTMDEDLPAELRVFPATDDRARHTILYPDQCEALP